MPVDSPGSMAEKWIQKAIKKKGVTGRRAHLAETLGKPRKGK